MEDICDHVTSENLQKGRVYTQARPGLISLYLMTVASWPPRKDSLLASVCAMLCAHACDLS